MKKSILKEKLAGTEDKKQEKDTRPVVYVHIDRGIIELSASTIPDLKLSVKSLYWRQQITKLNDDYGNQINFQFRVIDSSENLTHESILKNIQIHKSLNLRNIRKKTGFEVKYKKLNSGCEDKDVTKILVERLCFKFHGQNENHVSWLNVNNFGSIVGAEEKENDSTCNIIPFFNYTSPSEKWLPITSAENESWSKGRVLTSFFISEENPAQNFPEEKFIFFKINDDSDNPYNDTIINVFDEIERRLSLKKTFDNKNDKKEGKSNKVKKVEFAEEEKDFYDFRKDLRIKKNALALVNGKNLHHGDDFPSVIYLLQIASDQTNNEIKDEEAKKTKIENSINEALEKDSVILKKIVLESLKYCYVLTKDDFQILLNLSIKCFGENIKGKNDSKLDDFVNISQEINGCKDKSLKSNLKTLRKLYEFYATNFEKLSANNQRDEIQHLLFGHLQLIIKLDEQKLSPQILVPVSLDFVETVYPCLSYGHKRTFVQKFLNNNSTGLDQNIHLGIENIIRNQWRKRSSFSRWLTHNPDLTYLEDLSGVKEIKIDALDIANALEIVIESSHNNEQKLEPDQAIEKIPKELKQLIFDDVFWSKKSKCSPFIPKHIKLMQGEIKATVDDGVTLKQLQAIINDRPKSGSTKWYFFTLERDPATEKFYELIESFDSWKQLSLSPGYDEILGQQRDFHELLDGYAQMVPL